MHHEKNKKYRNDEVKFVKVFYIVANLCSLFMRDKIFVQSCKSVCSFTLKLF